MEARPYKARVDRDQLLVLRENVVVGYGRWTGSRIEALTGEPIPEAVVAQLARDIAAEEAAAVAALHESACDAEGVDLTLIDWILRMSPRERFDVLESYTGIPYRRILEVLAAHGVELVIVGGVAAHFYGASYQTKDMDIVYARTPENIARLLGALDEMDTIFRDFAGRRIRPSESYLVTANPKLLLTKHGPLDILGTLSMEEDGTGYEAIADDATIVDLGGFTVRVLSLPRLIEVKERLKRERDLLVLPLLRAALARASSR